MRWMRGLFPACSAQHQWGWNSRGHCSSQGQGHWGLERARPRSSTWVKDLWHNWRGLQLPESPARAWILWLMVCLLSAGLISCTFFLAADGLYSSGDDVIELTPSNFNREVIQSDSLWLVEFYAPWWVYSACGLFMALYKIRNIM